MPEFMNLDKAKAVFTQDYKDRVFYTWYSRGKCNYSYLHGLIDVNDQGVVPSIATLGDWVSSKDWKDRAEELDRIVNNELQTQVVTEKIEMLKRHAELGKYMIDTAKEYIEEHKTDLTMNVAARLLVEGVRIERESRGLPTLLAVADSGDEELLEYVKKLTEEVGNLELPENAEELSDM